MLKKNQYGLQYRENESMSWMFVFCHKCGKIIVTPDHKNAIIGDDHSLNYFRNMFANYEFRISKFY